MEGPEEPGTPFQYLHHTYPDTTCIKEVKKKKKRCKIAPPHAHHVMIRGDFTQMSQENKSSGLTMTIGTEFTGEARMHLKAASDKPVLQLCSSFGLGY